MTSRAGLMVQTVRKAVASLTRSAYQTPMESPVRAGLGDGITTFNPIDTLRALEKSGKSGDFVVTLNPGQAHDDSIVTGPTGTGEYILRVFVIFRQINDGMSDTDFSSVVADEHRIVADGVPRYFRTNPPAGLGDCRLEGGVSVSFDELGGNADSICQFRIVYADTVQ